MAVEIFFESFVEYIDELKTSGPGAVADLWSDDTKGKEIIVTLRTSCSSYLKHNQELFSAYLDGFSSIEEFCRMEVDPMEKDRAHENKETNCVKRTDIIEPTH